MTGKIRIGNIGAKGNERRLDSTVQDTRATGEVGQRGFSGT